VVGPGDPVDGRVGDPARHVTRVAQHGPVAAVELPWISMRRRLDGRSGRGVRVFACERSPRLP